MCSRSMLTRRSVVSCQSYDTYAFEQKPEPAILERPTTSAVCHKEASGRLEAASTLSPNHARLPRDAVAATGPHGCS